MCAGGKRTQVGMMLLMSTAMKSRSAALAANGDAAEDAEKRAGLGSGLQRARPYNKQQPLLDSR